jgi:small subunit ribosomal protein S17
MVQRGVKKRLTGIVVGNEADKTAAVLVSRLKKHGIYKKYLKRRTKYLAHDPQNKCLIGDRVKIIETRPISKKKRWQVVEILERGAIEEHTQGNNSSVEQKS